MKREKGLINVVVSIHPYQAAIVRGLVSGKINLKTDTLREIAIKSGDKKMSAQRCKHHINALVKLGVIQIIYGKYVFFNKKNKRHDNLYLIG